ncbi:hypothetical protein RSAG8_14014, partial [Rhizoctonia solani AG-8 WAC10335]
MPKSFRKSLFISGPKEESAPSCVPFGFDVAH